jgi:hypothetical protein
MTTKAILSSFMCIAVLALTVAPVESAEIPWYTIDSGGTELSTGGPFALSGTAGQADAGVLSGGNFVLVGGFWTPAQTGGGPFSPFTAQPSASAPLDQNFPDADEVPAPEPQPAQCPGDLDGDGVTNTQDLAQLLAHYGVTGDATYEDGDLDGDGSVGLSDLGSLLGHYGDNCP